MLDKLTSDDFKARLNQKFQLQLEGLEPLELELIQVSNLGREPDPTDDLVKRWAFAVVFRGPNEPILSQRIYPLQHPEMGQLDLFLVPVGPTKTGMQYEAVFT